MSWAWPGGLGAMFNAKPVDGVTVRLLEVVTLWVPAVTSIGPVAAPGGITNDKLALLDALIGALRVPPPCCAKVTVVAPPLVAVKLLPITVITVPIEPVVGANPEMLGTP